MAWVPDMAALTVESQPICVTDFVILFGGRTCCSFVLGCEGNEKPIQRSVLYETILPRARCCAGKVMRACETQRQDA